MRSTVLQEKFAPWERGQIVHSAHFLLDFSEACELPETALSLSRKLISAEAASADEIAAASEGGIPWKNDFPKFCLRCSRSASWRPVLSRPPGLPEEMFWRYERPENHVPLCRRCAAILDWKEKEKLRLDLDRALWGRRFDAFFAFHRALSTRRLPADWDKLTFPLWPAEFGGKTWECGCGALFHADPRPPEGVRRTRAHRAALFRVVSCYGGTRKRRGSVKCPPWLPLLELAGIPHSELGTALPTF